MTPDGHALLERTLPILAEIEGNMLAVLPLAERRAFLLALERLTAHEE